MPMKDSSLLFLISRLQEIRLAIVASKRNQSLPQFGGSVNFYNSDKDCLEQPSQEAESSNESPFPDRGVVHPTQVAGSLLTGLERIGQNQEDHFEDASL